MSNEFEALKIERFLKSAINILINVLVQVD